MPKAKRKRAVRAKRVLAIDIGGTGLKAAIVGPTGKFLARRHRIATPDPCPPARMIKALGELTERFENFDHVTVGFPGFVRNGVVLTAPNLGTRHWAGFALERAIEKMFAAPTRLLNDADVQGLAVIKGEGLELVCTLGTGLGTAWFRDGELMPHMDLSHMAIHHKHDFDVYIGEGARKKIGDKQWNKRLAKMIPMLVTVFNYDYLYLGGGNAKRVTLKLPRNVIRVSNDAGMEGGAFAWNDRRPVTTGK